MKSSSIFRIISIGFLVFNLNRFAIAKTADWEVFFESYHPFMVMGETRVFNFKIENLNKTDLIESEAKIQVVSDSNILKVSKRISLDEIENNYWNGSFEAKVFYIGRVNIFVEIYRKNNEKERSTSKVTLTTLRKPTLKSDYIEAYHVYEFAFYILLRVLCGSVINWHSILKIIQRPVSPGISAFCYFILTPLVSRMHYTTI